MNTLGDVNNVPETVAGELNGEYRQGPAAEYDLKRGTSNSDSSPSCLPLRNVVLVGQAEGPHSDLYCPNDYGVYV